MSGVMLMLASSCFFYWLAHFTAVGLQQWGINYKQNPSS